MKYIIIERVLKEKCPPGVDNFWNFSKIPREFWQIWDKREIDEDITPDIYSDQMDENIEGYSRLLYYMEKYRSKFYYSNN